MSMLPQATEVTVFRSQREYLFFVMLFFILQVNLFYSYWVIKLATQGRQSIYYNQWVTGYKVACSMDGADFNTVKDTSSGSDKVKISID